MKRKPGACTPIEMLFLVAVLAMIPTFSQTTLQGGLLLIVAVFPLAELFIRGNREPGGEVNR